MLTYLVPVRREIEGKWAMGSSVRTSQRPVLDSARNRFEVAEKVPPRCSLYHVPHEETHLIDPDKNH